MINAIIKGIFNLITTFFDFLFSPIISFLFSLFPSLENIYTFLYNFLDSALTHVSLVLDILLVPTDSMLFLFDYFLICYTIFISIRAIKFVITIYNKFKI